MSYTKRLLTSVFTWITIVLTIFVARPQLLQNDLPGNYTLRGNLSTVKRNSGMINIL